MQTVFESDLGVVKVACPWCHYSIHAQVIVSEEQTADMFYTLKAAYERLLFLQYYDSARVHELTRLEYSPITELQKSPALSCHNMISDTMQAIDDAPCCCKGDQHCPG